MHLLKRLDENDIGTILVAIALLVLLADCTGMLSSPDDKSWYGSINTVIVER